MKSTLTPLFLAPARVGRLISQVCRCSCGSLSEIYSQYLALPERHMLSPNQLSNCKPSRPDRCNDCESDERRMRAAQWYATMSRRNAGYTTILPNDRRARSPEQAEYFRLAPRQLPPGFVTFKPGEYERATSTQDFSEVQRSFAKAAQMLHKRGKDLPLGPAFDRMMQDLANAAYNAPRIPELSTEEVQPLVATAPD
jgi:hypothetical protein